MNETLRLIIAQHQMNFLEQYPIVSRDMQILPVPRKATVIVGIRRGGKSTWQHERIQTLLGEGVSKEQICYIDFSDDRLDFLRLESTRPTIIADTYYGMYPQNHTKNVYFFFDELQYVHQWGPFINRLQSTEKCEIYIRDSHRTGRKDIHLGTVSLFFSGVSPCFQPTRSNNRYCKQG
jgi:predicted AAA+ superfamily ATPase